VLLALCLDRRGKALRSMVRFHYGFTKCFRGVLEKENMQHSTVKKQSLWK